MQSTTLRLPEDIWRKVRVLASAQGLSANRWLTEHLQQLTANVELPKTGDK